MLNKRIITKACFRAIINIISEGTTDVSLFNRAFEIDLLKDKNFKDEVCKAVQFSINKNNFSDLKIHKLGHVLVPKKNLSDYRKCALIDVYDEIVFLTLLLTISNEIEKMRVNKSKKRVFSYRFGDFGEKIFDGKYNLTSFRETVSNKSKYKKNKVVVECDISNFYDRVNIHRIESVLNSNPNIDKDIIKLINSLLLFWANRDSYGLPVGSNASRILAEVALIEVDNYLISKGIDFCRFVDDYRIFAKNAAEAHNSLALLTHRLSKEGLFLNTQKTKIRNISEVSKDQESNTENKKVLTSSIIIRGYAGLVPLKFRRLSDSEINNFKEKDLSELLIEANQSVILEEKQVTTLIKTIIAQEQYDYLVQIPKILEKYPQFIPYFIDTILKYPDIPATNIAQIQEDFKSWLLNNDIPEYIQVSLVKLYAESSVPNKEILLNSFRRLRRNSGDYIGRALLEAMNDKLGRGEILEIREYYNRADLWEKRQILKLINYGIPNAEKEAFFRDIRIHEQDLFIKNIILNKKII